MKDEYYEKYNNVRYLAGTYYTLDMPQNPNIGSNCRTFSLKLCGETIYAKENNILTIDNDKDVSLYKNHEGNF